MRAERFGGRSRGRAIGLGALVALGAALPIHAQAQAAEAPVKAALQACQSWVGDGDMDAGRAIGNAADFLVIGPGGSWFQNDVQAVRFAMSASSGSARRCLISILPQIAGPDDVVRWTTEWMRDEGYVNPHLNGPPKGYLLEARAFETMSGSLDVMALPNGTLTVNLSTLGY